MKKGNRNLSGFLCVIGMLFSKYMYDKYDQDYMVVAMTICLVGVVAALLVLIYNKQYLAAFATLIFVSPMGLIAIGIYSENIYFTGAGVLSVFIIIPTMIMVMKKKFNK